MKFFHFFKQMLNVLPEIFTGIKEHLFKSMTLNCFYFT